MDAATIAARVAMGYARAAAVLGPEYAVYRPGDNTLPMSVPVGTVNAVFKPKGAKIGAPNTPQNPWFDGFMDTSIMLPGDILSGADGIYIAWQLPTLGAVLAVQCNRTVTVSRPGPQDGADYYGGAIVDAPVAAGWPASALQGTKGEAGPVALPGDTRLGWVSILMPAPGGVQIRSGDVITTTDQGMPMRYIVAGAELTDGWRIMAGLAAA